MMALLISGFLDPSCHARGHNAGLQPACFLPSPAMLSSLVTIFGFSNCGAELAAREEL
ncbi:hypothetical protein GQ53DRAFT_745457, partial [Thozetella sp. PMI_491]